MPVTWEDIIRDSLIEIGVKAAGEPLDDTEKEDSFRRLQYMLEDWGTEGLLVPGLATLDATFGGSGNPKSGKHTYTMGPSGNGADIETDTKFNIIVSFGYRYAGHEQHVPIRPTNQLIVLRNLRSQANHPIQYHYERGHPLSTIYLDANTDTGDDIRVVGRGYFDLSFEIDDDPLEIIPSEYRRTVMLNLAVELSSSYGVKEGRQGGLSPTTLRLARKSKTALKNRNLHVLESQIDPTLSRQDSNMIYGRGNWYGY